MRQLAILAALALAGCGGIPKPAPPGAPVEVGMAVAVSCVPAELPPRPTWRDTIDVLLAAEGFAERDAFIKEEWALKNARLDVLEGVVENCRQPGKPK